MKKIIAFSLFGEAPMYWKGALLNIELAKKYYPDWICRFYIDRDSKKELIQSIKGDNVEIYLMENKGGYNGTFWRFYPMEDDDVSVVISRDADSRIGQREVDAVNEWLKSDKQFHIMRDAEAHTAPILAGMFGVKNPLLKGIKDIIINNIKDFSNKFSDQMFLGHFLYPRIITHALEHCDHNINYGNTLTKFPSPLINNEFVGRCYGNEFYE